MMAVIQLNMGDLRIPWLRNRCYYPLHCFQITNHWSPIIHDHSGFGQAVIVFHESSTCLLPSGIAHRDCHHGFHGLGCS